MAGRAGPARAASRPPEEQSEETRARPRRRCCGGSGPRRRRRRPRAHCPSSPAGGARRPCPRAPAAAPSGLVPRVHRQRLRCPAPPPFCFSASRLLFGLLAVASTSSAGSGQIFTCGRARRERPAGSLPAGPSPPRLPALLAWGPGASAIARAWVGFPLQGSGLTGLDTGWGL